MKNLELEKSIKTQLQQIVEQLGESTEKLSNLSENLTMNESATIRALAGSEVRFIKSALAQLDQLDYILQSEVRS